MDIGKSLENKKASLEHKKKSLFITYDGLLDPLGGSQILPYLYSISVHPRGVHVISFEKSERFREGAERLRAELQNKGIRWTPLSFTSRFGKLGKVWDLLKMYLVALYLQLRYKFEVIHCRSYQAMQVGCFLRTVTRTKTIFDMRGLWVDDRVEGHLWPQNRLPYRLLYRYYKLVERKLLECADAVVVLTNRVVPEIRKLAPDMKAPITVIPCCADFDHFIELPLTEKRSIRYDLGIEMNALVVSYLGSLGTVYLLDEMLSLFETLARDRSDAHLLLITRDWSEEWEAALINKGMSDLRDRIHVRAATREEVPKFLGAADIMLSFRRSTYSQMACSPTKLAEAFALGIPVVSNKGVGDVDAITQELDGGLVIDLDNPAAFREATCQLDAILAKGGIRLRTAARERFGLEKAKLAYKQVYDQLEIEQ